MNHRNYIGAYLKRCIGNGRKVHFWTDYWIYMMELNHNTSSIGMLNQEMEWNILIISNSLPPNVLLDIKSIPIPSSPVENRVL